MKLASVFDIELRDLFDFGHHAKKKDLQRIIINTSKNAPEEKLRLLVKFIDTLNK